MIDVHAHPFLIPSITAGGLPAMESFMARAAAGGVSDVLGAAINIDSARQLAAWAAALPGLYVAAGWHPWYLADYSADSISLLREFCRSCPKLLAIGEIGVDGAIDTPPAAQLPAFREQLALAAELGLPAIIHARKATQLVVDELLSRPPQPVVLHSFSGSMEQLKPLLARGDVYVSFSGSLTRHGGRKLAALARNLPLEVILLETDCPSINIDGVPYGQAESANLGKIAEKLAALRGVEVAAVAEITASNSRRLLGINHG